MAKGTSYDIIPKLPLWPTGTILKNKQTLLGTNAVGVWATDEDCEFGNEEIEIPQDSILTYVENRQMMSYGNEKPMSAWIRCHMLLDDKVVWVTLLCEPKRIWDFETLRGKRKIIKQKMEEGFEILQMGTGEK